MHVMRVTAKGRITIPKAIRDMGFVPGTDVEFVTNGKAVYLVKPARPAAKNSFCACAELLPAE
jgi:AbrB family looped-hinge helix DNA binding protein